MVKLIAEWLAITPWLIILLLSINALYHVLKVQNSQKSDEELDKEMDELLAKMEEEDRKGFHAFIKNLEKNQEAIKRFLGWLLRRK